jgi:cell wall assembly regulator SMI1
MNILDIIEELEKFSRDILSLNTSVKQGEILRFEEKYNLKLPLDYKTLINKYNGISLYGVSVYGINEGNNSYSLEECYSFEHYEVENKMPLYLIPFSPDGGGNHYCFDSRKNDKDSCPIIFWQHDYPYSDEDLPEVTNTNFVDWVKEVMIDWTLEDYNYDGTEKSN